MLDYTQLEALLAVDDTGTFEGAARKLNLSSFAVVQRIKVLESKLGVKLIDRSPTRTTDIGKVLCDHTREVISLEGEFTEQYHSNMFEAETGDPILKVAIVDESFSDWFLAIADDNENLKERLRLDIQLTDSEQAVDMMKTGQIVAALTMGSQTGYGFKTYKIGTLGYRAVASPSYIAEHFSEGVTLSSLLAAPTIHISACADLSFEWIRQVFRESVDLPLSRYPSAHGALQACLDGKLWMMQSQIDINTYLQSGELLELIPNKPLRRTLYWHVAGNMLDKIRFITSSIKSMAHENAA